MSTYDPSLDQSTEEYFPGEEVKWRHLTRQQRIDWTNG